MNCGAKMSPDLCDNAVRGSTWFRHDANDAYSDSDEVIATQR